MSARGFLLYMLAVGGGLTLIANRKSYQVYSLGAFFQPKAVATIAQQLPHNTEDEFILAAWQYAGQIPYEAIGSDMEFLDGEVLCEDCYLPTQTLTRRVGNCVAKSSLLASILANRIQMNRIQIIIGNYVGEKQGGHAWVELWRGDDWYLLEATKTPAYPVPWIPSDESYSSYQPEIILESNRLQRVSTEEVQNMMVGCACGNQIDKYGRRR